MLMICPKESRGFCNPISNQLGYKYNYLFTDDGVIQLLQTFDVGIYQKKNSAYLFLPVSPG